MGAPTTAGLSRQEGDGGKKTEGEEEEEGSGGGVPEHGEITPDGADQSTSRITSEEDMRGKGGESTFSTLIPGRRHTQVVSSHLRLKPEAQSGFNSGHVVRSWVF